MIGPSFCWHCGRSLSERTEDGSLIFDTVTDPIGNAHRIHKSCKPGAENTFAAWKDDGNGKGRGGFLSGKTEPTTEDE